MKPTSNTPPERGSRTFSAARRQLGRALAGPLGALGERLLGGSSDASKAAARSKYRLQQVLTTDRVSLVDAETESSNGQIASPVSHVAAAHVASVPSARTESSRPTRGAHVETSPGMLSSPAPRTPRAPMQTETSPGMLSAYVETSPGIVSSRPPPPAASVGTAPVIMIAHPDAPAEPARPEPPTPASRSSRPPPIVAPPPAGPEASQVVPAAPVAKPASPEITVEVANVADEPIRTRSMARLLASQGHHGRALAIYYWLLASNPSDQTLATEAEALRRNATRA